MCVYVGADSRVVYQKVNFLTDSLCYSETKVDVSSPVECFSFSAMCVFDYVYGIFDYCISTVHLHTMKT